ncbi:MAG: ABC transporter ATP-binding protein [Candidatus Gracilibacteria bacterium]
MNNKEILKKIFSEFIKTTGKIKFFLVVFFGIFVAILMFIEPLFFTQIIKIIEEYLKTGEFDYNYFYLLMTYWGLFIIISTGSMLLYRYNFVTKSALKNHINLSKKYSNEIINMSFPTYLNKEVGSIYKIFDRGLESQYGFFYFFFLELIKSGSGIIFVVIVLFYYDPIMAFITLSLLPVMIIFGIVFYKKLYPEQKSLDKEWESIYHDLGNTMSVFSLVKTLTIEKVFSRKINKKLDNTYNRQIKIDKGWTISDMYTSLFTTISRFFVLGAGVYFILNGRIDFATLFLFFSYIGWVYFPLGFLFSKLAIVQKQITASGRFYQEFDNLTNEHKNKKGIKKTLNGSIEFKQVHFAYNKKIIIDNLSFKVKKGERIAFVGNTGAGKSTIINLFLRFWDLKKGSIIIDGTNVKKLNLKNFRQQIGIISQDSSLFNLSIKENLLFANKKASNIEIKKALEKAEANFVFDLDDGINTLIGERGLKLSGGEKQRLAIARLFLKNPKILILDEATSALDNKTEKKVQNALEKLMKGRTTIIIAHRLTTIKNVDKIFMLKDGEIIESGNYAKLMKNKKDFYNLANPDNLVIS